jgi:uncharacterized protein YoxC
MGGTKPDPACEAVAGLAAAIASLGQHAEAIATMAANLRAQAADAGRRLEALRKAAAKEGGR